MTSTLASHFTEQLARVRSAVAYGAPRARVLCVATVVCDVPPDAVRIVPRAFARAVSAREACAALFDSPPGSVFAYYRAEQ
jgi:hypothetical protein